MAREVRAREFTARGIARARQFLEEVRQNPRGRKTPPTELLRGAEYTRAFRGDLTVQQRWHAFGSRREIGEYLAPRLEPFRTWIADRTSFWSWLGMFHFEDTVRIVDGAARLSPLDETFVIDRNDKQNLRGIHRHCLRSAWQLCEVHGEDGVAPLRRTPFHLGQPRRCAMAGRGRGRYPPEYKEQIVELVRAGRSPGSLAREFEPSEQTIRNWVKRADLDEGRRSDGLTTEARLELLRLKREVKRLRMERDILKKAAAWFARESDSIPSGGTRS